MIGAAAGPIKSSGRNSRTDRRLVESGSSWVNSDQNRLNATRAGADFPAARSPAPRVVSRLHGVWCGPPVTMLASSAAAFPPLVVTAPSVNVTARAPPVAAFTQHPIHRTSAAVFALPSCHAFRGTTEKVGTRLEYMNPVDDRRMIVRALSYIQTLTR